MSIDVSSPIVPQKALTHSGVFHADDVFAAALLTVLNPSIAIERSDRVPEGFDGLVFDLGGGRFDHHGETPRCRTNGVPYASFGLVWERFGTLLLPEEDARSFDEQLVQPIDLTDNIGVPNPLSRCISDFNPAEAADIEGFDKAFWQAVAFARGVIERRILQIRAERISRDELVCLMSSGDGKVLVLPRALRWRHAVVGSGYLVVVYPSLRGGYNVQCVPRSLDDTATVVSAPESWRGMPSDELPGISGIDGLTFCHKTGYLCAAVTLESAMCVAKMIIAACVINE